MYAGDKVRGIVMNKKIIKTAAITVVSIIGAFYLLFLILPFFLNGILNSYSDDITKIVEESSGFKVKLEKMQIMTTPKLTAGVKIGDIEVSLPANERFFFAKNAEVKISLIPLLVKKIELDKIAAESLYLGVKVKKDGHFLIEDYIPETSKNEQKPQTSGLPLGLKISNHLPNIDIKNYGISFIDLPTNKEYSLLGNKVKITDFIINKKIKIIADGEITLDNSKQFTFDINVFNKIMPDIDLNNFFLTPEPGVEETPQAQPQIAFNIIDIFEAIHKNQLSAKFKADVKTSGTVDNIDLKGYFNIDGLTLAVDGKKLPDGNLSMNFSGNKIKMLSKLYTAPDEVTEITGDFKTGRKPVIDLSFKSNAGINNIFNILDSIAKSFNYNDLETLSAKGALNADFNIKSNLKKVSSTGYFKIPEAKINYGLYNIKIDKIKADVDFAENNVNVKDISFSVFGQPLKANGTIKNDTTSDLHLTADKLLLKALIAATGQMAILKDNDIYSGTLSMNASLKGKLNKPVPALNLSVDNVNLKNKPSNTAVILTNTKIDISTDGKKYGGVVNLNNLLISNPMAKIKAPKVKITIGEKDIIIDDAYMLLDNSRIDITGKITDYLSKKLAIDINANGSLLANDLRMMIPSDLRKDVKAAGKLPLKISITGNDKIQKIYAELGANPSNYLSVLQVDQLKGKNMLIKSTIAIANDTLKFSDTGVYAGETNLISLGGAVNNLSKSQNLSLNVSVPALLTMNIPGFKNSKLSARGDINISGNALNPLLKGNVSIPSIRIPDMLLSLDNLEVSLDGVIANGKGTLKRFTSGGIIAENLSSDFSLKDNIFYLRNLAGDAFLGKVEGNISYNILNGKIGVDFKGSGLDALKAVEGAAGIKNALSGKLSFNAKLTLSGVTEAEMMKSLNGGVGFKIEDGAFLNIGRLENLLSAQNISANSILRAALAPITALPVIKNTANFKYITGELSFKNGWAQVKSIKTSGPSMAYYISGRYNLLNGTANLTILGRLGSDVVTALGPLGDLSVDKLTSFIPKFGKLTGNVIKTLTTNPKGENVAAIPALSSGNKNYKDFKVLFNGGIESRTSVKSFKWLSNPDMTEIEAPSVKEQIETSKEAVQKEVKSRLDAIKSANEAAKQRSREAKQDLQKETENLKNNVENMKNLFKF